MRPRIPHDDDAPECECPECADQQGGFDDGPGIAAESNVWD